MGLGVESRAFPVLAFSFYSSLKYCLEGNYYRNLTVKKSTILSTLSPNLIYYI